MKKIIYILGILFLTASCDDSISELNIDEKNPSVVPVYTLFTNAQRTLTDQLTNTNVNRNIFRLLNQQWTETTYVDESKYDFVTRKISDNHWNALYAGPLADLNQAKKYLLEEVILTNDPDYANKIIIKNNKIALIDIMMVYTYQILVDTFGDIPYSEALTGSQNYLPKYDKAFNIYEDLIARINNDINMIDATNESFGESDLYYSGDLIKWKKFANSVKLKIGVNLLASNLDNPTATSAIQSAYSDGLISSNVESCKLAYDINVPNTNQIYIDMVFSGRNDFVVAKPFVDKIVSYNDPRKEIYFNHTYKAVVNGALVTITGYKGGNVGVTNRYSRYTHVSDKIKAPDFKGTLLDYSEVEFLLAEAVERGVGVGVASTHYTNAISASMEDWGVDAANISTYLAQPDVDYATAASTWQEKIGNQAWIAMFNRGFEGWTFSRRLDFPVLNAPASAVQEANGKIPVRMAYPIREQTLNGTNWKAAADAIGGDLLTTKLFWDLN